MEWIFYLRYRYSVFFTKTGVGEVSKLCNFLDADGPLHDAERGEKMGISFDLLFG